MPHLDALEEGGKGCEEDGGGVPLDENLGRPLIPEQAPHGAHAGLAHLIEGLIRSHDGQVVVGLQIYLLLSNAGPLGWLRMLYTPTAMIIAQAVLITPIVAALSREIVEQLNNEYAEQFRSLCVPATTAVGALLWDARYSLLTVALAGFGRAVAEVGAVIIVGGNIDHLTRDMTTAIALVTAKGDLALALALGILLITIALQVNAAVMMLRLTASRYAYA